MEKEDTSLYNFGKEEQSKGSSFFCEKQLDKSCSNPIAIRFRTLFLEHQKRQIDLCKFLGVDDAYVSRIARGLQIPPLLIRLKIAKFFNTDSSLIWRVSDLGYIKGVLK